MPKTGPGKTNKPTKAKNDKDSLPPTPAADSADSPFSYAVQESDTSVRLVPQLEIFTRLDNRPEEAFPADSFAPSISPPPPLASAAADVAEHDDKDAPAAFGPPERTLFKTAIHAFMQEEQKEEVKRQARHQVGPGGYVVRALYHQPPPPSPFLRVAKWGLAALVMITLVFGVVSLERRYGVSNLLARLKSSSGAPEKAGKTRRSPSRVDPSEDFEKPRPLP